MSRTMERLVLRGRTSARLSGLVAAVLLVVLCTLVIYPLKHITPVSSLGVVYLFGVVLVSAFWGLWPGLLTAVLSATAFNFFHLPPLGRFTISDTRNWFALTTFLAAAVASSSVGGLARRRAQEAEARRTEADLAAEMARVLLARAEVEEALASVGRRVAQAFALPWANVVLGRAVPAARHDGIALRSGGRTLGTLELPAGLPEALRRRLRDRVVPALSAMVAVALERERLVDEAVKTEGLRRSDAVKTALLRAISHDFRSPVTAMIAAGAAIRAPELTTVERDELGRVVVQEGSRLSRLIEDLLDLSKLEAQALQSRPAECSVEEVVDAALAAQPAETSVDVRIDPDLPLVRADFAQLERALANLLENAVRYSAGKPVTVRGRAAGERVLVSVVDQGPGVPASDRERIFEPFYRGTAAAERAPATGSGLGLAIARGFVEANGGRIRVESAPGQGTSFVVELPALAEVAVR